MSCWQDPRPSADGEVEGGRDEDKEGSDGAVEGGGVDGSSDVVGGGMVGFGMGGGLFAELR